MVNAILKNKEDIKNYMKQYRENNKDKIYELQQKSYNCPYCNRENIHIYYMPTKRVKNNRGRPSRVSKTGRRQADLERELSADRRRILFQTPR